MRTPGGLKDMDISRDVNIIPSTMPLAIIATDVKSVCIESFEVRFQDWAPKYVMLYNIEKISDKTKNMTNLFLVFKLKIG